MNITVIILSEKSYIWKNTESMSPFTWCFKNRQNQTRLIKVRTVVIDRDGTWRSLPSCYLFSGWWLHRWIQNVNKTKKQKRYSSNYSHVLRTLCSIYLNFIKWSKIVMIEGVLEGSWSEYPANTLGDYGVAVTGPCFEKIELRRCTLPTKGERHFCPSWKSHL